MGFGCWGETVRKVIPTDPPVHPSPSSLARFAAIDCLKPTTSVRRPGLPSSKSLTLGASRLPGCILGCGGGPYAR
jgi:hypothetical protein